MYHIPNDKRAVSSADNLEKALYELLMTRGMSGDDGGMNRKTSQQFGRYSVSKILGFHTGNQEKIWGFHTKNAKKIWGFHFFLLTLQPKTKKYA